MRIAEKLVKRLHKIFSRDPDKFLALRFRYDGAMSWKIDDCVLTTDVSDDIGEPLNINLSDYTLAELAEFIGSKTGYSIAAYPPSEYASLSGRVLVDGGKNQNDRNGDHLYGFLSIEWAYQDAVGVELEEAARQIHNAIQQLSIPSAQGEWLDYIGNIYGIYRLPSETDAIYGPRIVYDVLVPRNNNKAIEMAITRATGGQAATVTNVTEERDGKIVGNMFDIEYGFDLEGSEDIKPFADRVLALIDEFRSAGTHLRGVNLAASQLEDDVLLDPEEVYTLTVEPTLEDTAPASADETPTLSASLSATDTVPTSSDGGADLTLLSQHTYNGAHKYGGSPRTIYYNSGTNATESL